MSDLGETYLMMVTRKLQELAFKTICTSLQVLVASNDHDVSESCWSNEIFPMNSSQLLHEIRKVTPLFVSQSGCFPFKDEG